MARNWSVADGKLGSDGASLNMKCSRIHKLVDGPNLSEDGVV